MENLFQQAVQPFQLAGAKTVLATLWSVDDDAMPLLLREFFEQLVEGKTKAEALAAAQRELIKDHESNYGVAHPFFWAALTVTGDDGKFQ